VHVFVGDVVFATSVACVDGYLPKFVKPFHCQ